ncbi:MAG TPA: MBL fold metallo-hydrolase [Bacteroidales bacterium]|nr:MBL fold metallo-hydrolase [Bacteroidales bacterium]
MKIQFLGAAREVTGSKHLITLDSGKKILLDCGMYQGKGMNTDTMNRNLGFNPPEIDFLLLSHAHIDHSGLIPYISKNGFTGKVITTHATRDLCAIMLADCGKIQEHDTQVNNKKRARKNLPPLEPIYTKADAEMAMQNFIGVAYDKPYRVTKGVKVTFTNSGHLLGSAVINIKIKEGEKVTYIAFTGDIGRPVNRILISPQPFKQADILLCESTYGDRLHEPLRDAEDKLLDIIRHTCIEKKGKLIIPSFSVGRTQEVLFSLNSFYNSGKLPKIKVFVDSPLSVNATNIFRLHKECFNETIAELMETDPDPFGFNDLHFISQVEDSKRLNDTQEPCIIISASGMMEAGRVKHHLANSISNPKNTVLAVGYCAPSTLGARILRGDKEVSIFGTVYPVKADIERLDSYSGHADYSEIMRFLECQDKSLIKKLFLVHGEYKSQQFFQNELQKAGYTNISIPEIGETIEI